MTFPLLPVEPTPARRVRCANPLCGRWLRDPESIARRYGRDCAEELGLIPPRRHGLAVVSGAADQPLFDINEGDAMADGPTPDASYMAINEGLDVVKTLTIRGDLLVDVSVTGRVVGVERIGGPVDTGTLVAVLFALRVEGV